MAPYTFVEDLEAEVLIPDHGVLSRTLFNDEALKVIAFGFSAGPELPPHSAPMAAVLQFLKGQAELTLGGEKETLARDSCSSRSGAEEPPQQTSRWEFSTVSRRPSKPK